jgi:hypothetical protein
MTGDEHIAWRNTVRRFRTWLKKRGVPIAPLLMLRVRELATLVTIGYRLEARLAPPGAVEVPGQIARAVTTVIPDIEAVIKHLERVRKAVSELETYAAATAAPTPLTVADIVKPLMEKARAIRARYPEDTQ